MLFAPLILDFYNESVAKLDSELRPRSMPLLWRSLPLYLDVSQGQVDQLDCCLIARKVPLVPDRLPDLAVQRLDGVRHVDDLSHVRRGGK